jgi:hypothetical protein
VQPMHLIEQSRHLLDFIDDHLPGAAPDQFPGRGQAIK